VLLPAVGLRFSQTAQKTTTLTVKGWPGEVPVPSDGYLAGRKALTYIAPDSLDNDPLDWHVLARARGLAALAASSRSQDVPPRH
jgi:hypothetical protein